MQNYWNILLFFTPSLKALVWTSHLEPISVLSTTQLVALDWWCSHKLLKRGKRFKWHPKKCKRILSVSTNANYYHYVNRRTKAFLPIVKNRNGPVLSLILYKNLFCFLNTKFEPTNTWNWNKILKQPIAVTTEVPIAEAMIKSKYPNPVKHSPAPKDWEA